MSAARQPLDVDFSSNDNWQSLLRDQGYRLFAAGNGKAVIVEGLSLLPEPVPMRGGPSFDSQFGLNPGSAGANRRYILLTEVSRAPHSSRASGNGTLVARARQASPWNAVRSIQPLANLSSYMADRAGSLTFFLVRGARTPNAPGNAHSARLDASAVQIGRSLGLSQPDLEALRVAGLVCELSKPNLAETSVTAGDTAEYPGIIEAPSSCQFPNCASKPAVALEMKHYCRDHFIVHCYQRLDSCAATFNQRPAGDEESEELRSFLRACVEQATALTRAPFLQDSLERARLLDIRYTASELLRRMRRSPRVAEARPVLLRCETPGRPWQEQLHTVLISRFGAMFECAHFVRPEDWLFVERLDTGLRARARMAWRAPAKAGHFSVGLEFLDADNFWGLNWRDLAPAARPA